jgi:hypothetical protein
LVEQWIENPCVPGSIPGETTLQKTPISAVFSKNVDFTINILKLIKEFLTLKKTMVS